MIRVLEIVRKFSTEPYVIINKSDLNPSIAEQIREWCNKNDVYLAGYLPFSQDIVKAMVEGKSICEYDPESNLSKTLEEIWKKILNQTG